MGERSRPGDLRLREMVSIPEIGHATFAFWLSQIRQIPDDGVQLDFEFVRLEGGEAGGNGGKKGDRHGK